MSGEQIQRILNAMELDDAAATLAELVKRLLPSLGADGRREFIASLIASGDPEDEQSLVHF